MINSMLINYDLSGNLWIKALLFVCYILKEVLQKDFNATPNELWIGRKSNLDLFFNLGSFVTCEIFESTYFKLTIKGLIVHFVIL